MPRFDRYLLSQLLVFFGFFAIILVALYWVNRAVRLFDWLIASGQSATVFLEFTALTLPNVIRVVLPIAAFAASVYTANRLSSESELVVVQATGYGPFRLARPVLIFGLIVGVFVSFLVHFAVPLSHARIADREIEVTDDIAARILTEGRFVHPEPDVTIYIREVTGQGVLRDVFLHDAKDPRRTATYTADRARLVRTDSGPRLVMLDGMSQNLSMADRTLSLTRYAEFGTDISSLLAPGGGGNKGRSIRELSTGALLRADPAVAEEIGQSPNRMRIEGHQRFARAFLAVVAPILGFATILVGGFSRFGVSKQVMASVAIVVFLSTLDSALEDAAKSMETGWPLVYVAPVVGVLMTLCLLWLAANPVTYRWRRRVRA